LGVFESRVSKMFDVTRALMSEARPIEVEYLRRWVQHIKFPEPLAIRKSGAPTFQSSSITTTHTVKQ
jgi:hypothetical protein